jgi:hypothetical protein
VVLGFSLPEKTDGSLRSQSHVCRVIPKQNGDFRFRVRATRAPEGTPCSADTRGLLKYAHVIAEAIRYVGKEADRKLGTSTKLHDYQRAVFQKITLGGNIVCH